MNEKRDYAFIVANFIAVVALLLFGLIVCKYVGTDDHIVNERVQQIEMEQQRNLERARSIHATVDEVRAINERARRNIEETRRLAVESKSAIERIRDYAEENERIFQSILERAEKDSK